MSNTNSTADNRDIQLIKQLFETNKKVFVNAICGLNNTKKAVYDTKRVVLIEDLSNSVSNVNSRTFVYFAGN